MASAASTSKTLRADYTDGTTATYSATTAVTGTAIGLASVAITTPATNPYDFGNVTIGGTAPSVTAAETALNGSK